MKGKVWLVGAGPSDPGLFTLRGRQVLQKADVVVCDALVGQGILSMIPEQAERVYVGKRSGSHAVAQEEINRLLVDLALGGKRVARLKGGDPFLFGRGGEEMEFLAENGIPFEVVPGVTSAISVPAYQGIPVTHRDFCSSVHIITGHKRSGAEDPIDFDALAKVGGTLIFLMGAETLGDICRGLSDAGMDPETPAALLTRGTTARQGRIVATLGALEGEAKRRGAETPAVIVVGKVCSLEEGFSWYERMPLAGVKVMLTRPAGIIGETAESLRCLGAEVVECPTIRTVRRENNKALRKALENPEEYQWIVFTSPTGVRIFFEEMRERSLDVRSLAGLRIAAIGSRTKKELEKRGLYADLVPEVFDGEHLGEALEKEGEPGERVLIPRAAEGNRVLTQKISHMRVDDVPIYDTIYEKTDGWREYRAELQAGEIDYVMFTSASCVRGFAAVFDGVDFSKLRAVCIGKQTMREAEELGMRAFVSEEASADSLISCLIAQGRVG